MSFPRYFNWHRKVSHYSSTNIVNVVNFKSLEVEYSTENPLGKFIDLTHEISWTDCNVELEV